jgi:hypothetical protein
VCVSMDWFSLHLHGGANRDEVTDATLVQCCKQGRVQNWYSTS